MNKKMINKVFILLAVGLFFAGPALANGGLSVDFEKEPLFEDENILPGQSFSSGSITINNQTGSKQELAVATIITSDDDGLGSQLRFFVKNGTKETDCGTIASLDNNNWCPFGEIENNSEKVFEFVVVFDPTSGNEYKNTEIGFNVAVGSAMVSNGENGNPSNSVTTYGTIAVAGGTGGPSVPRELYIFNEKQKEVGGTSATITWQTNYFSSTYIIYGEKPGVLDYNNPPFYGYEYYKEGDDTGEEKVTFHQITIHGLKPNTTYHYRCVSHGSLAISDPYEFTTSSFEQTDGDTPVSDKDIIITPPDYRGPVGQGSGTSSPSQGEEWAEDLLAQDDALRTSQWQEEESNNKKGIFNSLFATIGTQSICLLLILAIAILIILFFLSVKKGKIEQKRIYWILPFLAIGLFVLYSLYCPYWKIVGAIMLIVSLIVYIAMMLKA